MEIRAKVKRTTTLDFRSRVYFLTDLVTGRRSIPVEGCGFGNVIGPSFRGSTYEVNSWLVNQYRQFRRWPLRKNLPPPHGGLRRVAATRDFLIPAEGTNNGISRPVL